jgi:hypothetical protein
MVFIFAGAVTFQAPKTTEANSVIHFHTLYQKSLFCPVVSTIKSSHSFHRLLIFSEIGVIAQNCTSSLYSGSTCSLNHSHKLKTQAQVSHKTLGTQAVIPVVIDSPKSSTFFTYFHIIQGIVDSFSNLFLSSICSITSFTLFLESSSEALGLFCLYFSKLFSNLCI